MQLDDRTILLYSLIGPAFEESQKLWGLSLESKRNFLRYGWFTDRKLSKLHKICNKFSNGNHDSKIDFKICIEVCAAFNKFKIKIQKIRHCQILNSNSSILAFSKLKCNQVSRLDIIF